MTSLWKAWENAFLVRVPDRPVVVTLSLGVSGQALIEHREDISKPNGSRHPPVLRGLGESGVAVALRLRFGGADQLDRHLVPPAVARLPGQAL